MECQAKLLNKFNMRGRACDKFRNVNDWQGKLAIVVKRFMDEKNMNAYDVERVTGKAVSNTTVWNILNKANKDTGFLVLMEVVRGLKISPRRFFDALVAEDAKNVASSISEEYEIANSILNDYTHLASKDREFFRPYFNMLRAEIDRRLEFRESDILPVADLPDGKTLREIIDEINQKTNLAISQSLVDQYLKKQFTNISAYTIAVLDAAFRNKLDEFLCDIREITQTELKTAGSSHK
ncbi:MAG: hypothetical protein HY231_24100 [Acidobacteria bacterium]|nr:hypothetical protein [Acidobacteriota bacterium]